MVEPGSGEMNFGGFDEEAVEYGCRGEDEANVVEVGRYSSMLGAEGGVFRWDGWSIGGEGGRMIEEEGFEAERIVVVVFRRFGVLLERRREVESEVDGGRVRFSIDSKRIDGEERDADVGEVVEARDVDLLLLRVYHHLPFPALLLDFH